MIRVVLVDDHALVRSGVGGLLTLTDDIEVVGEAADGEAAIEVIESLHPDVVLLDVRMPVCSGLDALTRLQARHTLVPTILLTTFDEDEALLEGMRLGAKGFLLKDISLERLADAIRAVARGESLFRPAITERVLQGVREAIADFPCLPTPDAITPREAEVLRLMAGGFNNREIADALLLSEGTVKNHVSSILSKFGVRDRVRAVLRGLELGHI